MGFFIFIVSYSIFFIYFIYFMSFFFHIFSLSFHLTLLSSLILSSSSFFFFFFFSLSSFFFFFFFIFFFLLTLPLPLEPEKHPSPFLRHNPQTPESLMFRLEIHQNINRLDLLILNILPPPRN